jgi:hypothetical protein
MQNVVSPLFSRQGKATRKGSRTEERVKEGGGSEGSSIMEGIRIEIASEAKAG